jgi:hypothetical protein
MPIFRPFSMESSRSFPGMARHIGLVVFLTGSDQVKIINMGYMRLIGLIIKRNYWIP